MMVDSIDQLSSSETVGSGLKYSRILSASWLSLGPYEFYFTSLLDLMTFSIEVKEKWLGKDDRTDYLTAAQVWLTRQRVCIDVTIPPEYVGLSGKTYAATWLLLIGETAKPGLKAMIICLKDSTVILTTHQKNRGSLCLVSMGIGNRWEGNEYRQMDGERADPLQKS